MYKIVAQGTPTDIEHSLNLVDTQHDLTEKALDVAKRITLVLAGSYCRNKDMKVTIIYETEGEVSAWIYRVDITNIPNTGGVLQILQHETDGDMPEIAVNHDHDSCGNDKIISVEAVVTLDVG